MKNATRAFVSTFGAIMALAGIEHGIGEVLQGSVAPGGIMIQSWPESEFFRSLSGEPAMTIVPNLLVAGMLSIIFSLALMVWATLFVQKKRGALVMVLISIAMLLAGGGLFPPVFGILISVVAFKINAPLTWWRAHLSHGARRTLAQLWPWFYTACILSWFALLPGIPALEYFFGVEEAVVTLAILVFAISTLLLTIFSGFAYDIRMRVSKRSGSLDIDPGTHQSVLLP
jgi:hypothetical protein